MLFKSLMNVMVLYRYESPLPVDLGFMLRLLVQIQMNQA